MTQKAVRCCLLPNLLLIQIAYTTTASLAITGGSRKSECCVQRDACLPVATTPRMPHAGSELSEQQAQKEMAFRLNHARQTVEYVHRQVCALCNCINANYEGRDDLHCKLLPCHACCNTCCPSFQLFCTACTSPDSLWLTSNCPYHAIGSVHDGLLLGFTI